MAVQFPKTGDHVFVVDHGGDVLEGVVKAYSGAYNKNGSARKQFNTRLLAKVEITGVVINETGRATREIGDTTTVGLDTLIIKKTAGDKYNAGSMKPTSLHNYRKVLRTAGTGAGGAGGAAAAAATGAKTRHRRRKQRRSTRRILNK